MDPETVTPQEVTPEPAASVPDVGTSPPPADMYDVKVGGETFRVPLNELQAGYSRDRDYRQKTQRLADDRRTFDGERQQLQGDLTKLSAFLQDPAQVEAYLRTIQASSTPPPSSAAPAAPSAPMADPAAMQQFMGHVWDQSQRLAEVAGLRATYEVEINKALGTTLDGYPLLKAVDGIADLIRAEAGSRIEAGIGWDHATLDDAKTAIQEVAKARADRLKAAWDDHAKHAAVSAAKLKGIEPPGGAPLKAGPGPQPKYGSREFMSSVIDELNQAMSRSA